MTFQRRAFLQSAAAVAAYGSHPLAAARRPPALVANDPTVAVQIAPFNLFDEGIDVVLDRLQDLAAINTLFIYSHTYYGIPYSRPASVLADDHGHKPRDDQDRRFNPVWVRHNRKLFGGTSLWFAKPDPGAEYAGRDIFDEVCEPARKRGMRVFARLLEPGRLDVNGRIANFEQVTSVDVRGQLQNEPCRNNPQFRAFTAAMVTDLFTHYDLDGYQWGSERAGPLSELLYKGRPAGCFCKHCMRRARSRGIDPERARRGFIELEAALKAVASSAGAADSLANRVLAVCLQYHEILAWEHQWSLAVEETAELVYRSVKRIKPNAVVGRHIASAASTLDPIARAGNHYARMAGYADFIKPILYQDVMALRLKDTVENWSAGIFKNLPPQAALDLLGIFNNYSQKVLPSFKALDSEALPARYVFEETRRLVALSEGKCAVFPGLGVNVPHRVGKAFAGSAFDLQGISASVQMAFEAGATGVVASREYDEMRLPALRAFGDGVRSAGKRQGGGATKVPAAQP